MLTALWMVKTIPVKTAATMATPSERTPMTSVKNAPNTDIYAVDVSFAALKDPAEREYLNQLPTSFVLPDEAVDRLRAAPKKIILDSPDFNQLLREAGAHIVEKPAAPPAAPSTQ